MKLIDDIINTLTTEFATVINENYIYYQGYDIVLSSEQQFYRSDERVPGRIYIIVKFGEATLDYGQIVQPITIQAISEQDKLDVCQTLLYEFASKYNLNFSENRTVKQLYNAPYVLSNFNEVFEGFRSLLYVSGIFLFTKDSNYLNVYYDHSGTLTKTSDVENIQGKFFWKTEIEENVWIEEFKEIKIDMNSFQEKMQSTYGDKFNENKSYILYYDEKSFTWFFDEKPLNGNLEDFGINIEEIKNQKRIEINYNFGWKLLEVIASALSSDINMDSQAFYSSNGFTTSRAKFASRSFNITSYLLNNDFFNKCEDVVLENLEDEEQGIDTKFNLLLEFIGSGKKLAKNFRMANFSLQQQLDDIPIVSITFTN